MTCYVASETSLVYIYHVLIIGNSLHFKWILWVVDRKRQRKKKSIDSVPCWIYSILELQSFNCYIKKTSWNTHKGILEKSGSCQRLFSLSVILYHLSLIWSHPELFGSLGILPTFPELFLLSTYLLFDSNIYTYLLHTQMHSQQLKMSHTHLHSLIFLFLVESCHLGLLCPPSATWFNWDQTARCSVWHETQTHKQTYSNTLIYNAPKPPKKPQIYLRREKKLENKTLVLC